MNTHLSSQFDSELDSIRGQLTRMGGLVEEQLAAVLKAVSTQDMEVLEHIIASDKTIDALEMAIDDACIHIIARRQPTAVDLRVIVAIIKVVKDIERIGDEAKKIAKVIRKIAQRGGVGPLAHEVDLRRMGDQVLPMVQEVFDDFVRLDAVAAKALALSDREVDALFRATVRQLVTFMMEDPRTISTSLDLIFIAKSIERIGDHAKNIAEHVIFVAEGKDVRHGGLSEADDQEEGAELT